MNMSEVKERRATAEAKILEILRELERETGALVAPGVLASRDATKSAALASVSIELRVPA